MNKNKLRLLYLAQIFNEETDSEHGLTAPQIISLLEEDGISVERKTVYTDIEALREFGMDIRKYQRSKPEYGLASHDFDLAELTLLVDAVQSSKFLTIRKSNTLINALKKFTSRYQRSTLDKQLHVHGRINMQNESIYKNVDKVQEAIRLNKQIEFNYEEYDTNMKPVLRYDGHLYKETPVDLIYSNDLYYVAVYNVKAEKVINYRLDRMVNIRISKDDALKNQTIKDFDAGKFEEQSFRMFGGTPITVTFIVDRELMSTMKDTFGDSIYVHAINEDHARVTAEVIESPVFFGWLTETDGHIVIEKPKSVIENYRAYLSKILNIYND